MSNKLLGSILLSLPFLVLLLIMIKAFGLVEGSIVFLTAIATTVVVLLCVVKGIDLLDGE
jgi:ABC-type nitrate/sulfonate/bicarbonate transport system permease component